MSCYGCGQSGHEAWECSNHTTFSAWREHFTSLSNNYSLKTTKALHLNLKQPYVPPRSPHNLMQECLYNDPWKILVCCLCLNCTTGLQTRKVLLKFFDKYPTPQSLLAGNINEITQLIKPLGLWNKRPQALVQMTKGFLESDWTEPREIFGVGKYTNDAYLIFCCGKWRDVQPQDHMLNDYIKYINNINGIGYVEVANLKRPKRNNEPVQSKFFKKIRTENGCAQSCKKEGEVSRFFAKHNSSQL